jgi:hypothetical protein
VKTQFSHLLAILAAYPLLSVADETRTATPGSTAPKASIYDLNWLAGSWIGNGITGPAREVYSLPMGGTIAGHFVQTRNNAVWFYEIVQIRPMGDSLTYCLKHFNADLTGWEEKNDVQCFPLVAREGDAFYFDGLTVRRDGADAMISAVRVKQKDGSSTEYVFRYRKEKLDK